MLGIVKPTKYESILRNRMPTFRIYNHFMKIESRHLKKLKITLCYTIIRIHISCVQPPSIHSILLYNWKRMIKEKINIKIKVYLKRKLIPTSNVYPY